MSAPLNNYLLGMKSLGESNNPSAPVPTTVGTLPSNQQGGLTLTQLWGSIVGTISSTYNGGLTSMTLHDLFT